MSNSPTDINFDLSTITSRCKHRHIQKEFDKYDGKGKILSFTMWIQAAQDRIRVEPPKLQPLQERKGREREREDGLIVRYIEPTKD